MPTLLVSARLACGTKLHRILGKWAFVFLLRTVFSCLIAARKRQVSGSVFHPSFMSGNCLIV